MYTLREACGRADEGPPSRLAMPHFYHLDAPARAIAQLFGAAAGNDPWTGGLATPGSFAPVITAGREFIAGPQTERGVRRMVPRLWGVPPPPNAPDPRRLVLTLRNPESPFWIGNLRNSEFRCLVPATSFAEWGEGTDTEGRRLRHTVRAAGGGIMALAGVWKDSEVPGFALLTCPANAPLRQLGIERMPVIVPQDNRAFDCWLHSGWKTAHALVIAAPDGALRIHD
jgi:putative SOS response-associated peptidase YedK